MRSSGKRLKGLIPLILCFLLISPVLAVSYVDLERTVIGEFVGEEAGIEDFSTYAEVDVNNDITRTVSRVTWDTMIRNIISHVSKDKDAGHFGDFEHLIDITITDVEAGDADSRSMALIYVVSNIVGRPKTSDGIMVYIIQETSLDDKFRFTLQQTTGGVVDFTESGVNRNIGSFYLTMSRSGTTVTLKVYTDITRETLIETLSNAGGDATTYRYVQPLTSMNELNDPDDYSSGYVENLDLQEGGLYPENVLVDSLESSYEVKLYDSVPALVCNATANSEGLANMTLPLGYRSSDFEGTFRIFHDNSSFVYSKWFEDVAGGDIYEARTKSGGLAFGVIALIIGLFAFVVALASTKGKKR